MPNWLLFYFPLLCKQNGKESRQRNKVTLEYLISFFSEVL
jgi:hypothetical protein